MIVEAHVLAEVDAVVDGGLSVEHKDLGVVCVELVLHVDVVDGDLSIEHEALGFVCAELVLRVDFSTATEDSEEPSETQQVILLYILLTISILTG